MKREEEIFVGSVKFTDSTLRDYALFREEGKKGSVNGLPGPSTMFLPRFMDVSTSFSCHLSNRRVCSLRSKPVKCRALSFVTVLIGIIILETLKTILVLTLHDVI